MKTVRWLRINIPESKKDILGDLLLKAPFSEEVGEGFSIHNISENEILGSFIQSKPFIKEITSPMGETKSVTAIDYSKIDFKVRLNNPSLLEVYSKPRTLKPFINTLSNIIGFGFTITDINININDFINTLEEDLGGVKIVKMTISDINIKNKALGQLTLTSEQDLRGMIENQITLGRKFKIKYIQANLLFDPFYNGQIEIHSNSKLSISNLPHSLFISHFFQSFVKAI